MDLSAIIAAALAGGVAARLKDTSSAAVRDAYLGLRSALIARLPDKEAGRTLFDEVEIHPEEADILVHRALRTEHVRIDDELYQRARELLDMLADSDVGRSKYQIDIGRSQGVQIGDHNIQMNTFSVGED